jgi:hypothetical protein
LWEANLSASELLPNYSSKMVAHEWLSLIHCLCLLASSTNMWSRKAADLKYKASGTAHDLFLSQVFSLSNRVSYPTTT